jgi:hypothetical protein
MKVQAFVCGFLLLMAAPLGAGERLLLKVSPTVSFAPANLVVRTTIEADPANRSLAIVAESGDFYRSSQVQLDGDHAPRISTFEFRSLPPGVYTVRALLFDADGAARAQVGSQIHVVDSGAAR